MRLLVGILFFVTLFSSFSLKKDENNEWLGRKIIVPDGVVCKILEQEVPCADLWDKPYKVLTYVDSIGCSSCQIGMYQWKSFIDSFTAQQFDVSFVFVVHSSDFDGFVSDVRFYEFNYFIFYDYENRFDKVNNFMSSYHRTFLLDKDNKVLLTGSPIHNPKLLEQYKEHFNN